jgi:hypothetical protein
MNSPTVCGHTDQASCAPAVQAFGAQQQHHRLQEHAQVRPLRLAHATVDRAEQRHRRAEELVIAGKPAKTRRTVIARDAQGRVHVLADLEAAIAIGRHQFLRVDVVLGLFLDASLVLLPHDRAQSIDRLACDDVDMPGSQAPARG